MCYQTTGYAFRESDFLRFNFIYNPAEVLILN